MRKLYFNNLILALLLVLTSSLNAQKKQDIEAIKNMCGCFEYVKWSFVVDKWNTIYSKKDDISLRRSAEDKPLFSFLFDENIVKRDEIGLIIDRFVID